MPAITRNLPHQADGALSRLAPYLLLAFLLHLAVLLWARPVTIPPLSRPLVVHLEPRPMPIQSQAMADRTVAIADRTAKAAHAAASELSQTRINTHTSVPPSTAQLDVSKLLGQARDFARLSERTAAPNTNRLEGNYFGSYKGFDNGSFGFTLDRTGNGAGSGQSSRFGISFTIAGKVDDDGSIRMTGSGIAGAASFSGTLNPVTGEFHGKWTLAGKGSGTFHGSRERPLNQASPAIEPVASPIEQLHRALKQPHQEIQLANGMRKITTASGTSVCFQPTPYFAHDTPGLFGIPMSCP